MAILNRKEHDQIFGNIASWQLKSINPERNVDISSVDNIPLQSIYINATNNKSYIYTGNNNGGWFEYDLATKKTGNVVKNSTTQKSLTKAWQAQEHLKTT